MMTGNIPKKVSYIWGKAHVLGSFWQERDIDIKEKEKIEVLPAFCADSENLKTLETGRRWAGRDAKNPAKEQSFDNSPLDNIRIVSLEVRSEGGRAYKVIAERDGKSFYFDMREDVILDTMLEAGIKQGGFLCGQFIWCVVGSQMKLIRMGSKLYDKMLESTTLKGLGKVKELEVGGVYVGRNGKELTYLGRFDYIDIADVGRYSGWSNNYNVSYKCSLKKNLMLFEHYYPDDTRQENYRWFDFKSSHNLIKKVNTVKVPSDIVSSLKNYSIKNLLRCEKERMQCNNNNPKIPYCGYSDTAMIAKAGEKIIIPTEFEKLVEYIKSLNQWIE